jgi:hypothetical protein
MRTLIGSLAWTMALWGCARVTPSQQQLTPAQLTPQQRHGKDVWLNSTFGGEKFFSLVLPAHRSTC